MNLQDVLDAFNLQASPEQLSGGSRPTFKVGNAVLKRVEETSLENNHSPELIEWIAAFSQALKQDGFRFPKALQTKEGKWITPDGWTAWTVVAGRHSTKEDVAGVIEGIVAFHQALAGIPKHPLMDENQTAWGKADRWCWGAKPEHIHPVVEPLVKTFYELRRPVEGLKSQLIHGDLSLANILIAPHLPPAFLDLSPFWRPVEFAVGMYANRVGPRQRYVSVLKYFQHIQAFDQMVLRASIRMLLVMHVVEYVEDWETCSEKQAAELVINYVQEKKR
jgi:Ser/Thr protein kinase RdoA (MazF antagonist)